LNYLAVGTEKENVEQIVKIVLSYKYLKGNIMKYKILEENEPKFSKFSIFWTI